MKRFKLVMTAALVAVFMILVGNTTPFAHAQSVVPSAGATIPAAQVLKPDGRLNLNPQVSGALNLAGWQVSLDPQRGPVFTQAAPTTEQWSALGSCIKSAKWKFTVK